MLREANLISADDSICPILLTPRLAEVIVEDDASLLMVLPLNDHEIKELIS